MAQKKTSNYASKKKTTKTKKKMYSKKNRYLSQGLFAIKRPARAEKKFMDTVLTSDVVIPDTGVIFMPSVNVVPQGDGSSNRQGNHIDIVGIQVKLGINGQAAGSATKFDSCVKVMIVLDREPHGAVPPISNILAAAEIRSWNNTAFDKRFLTLKTWDLVIKRQPYAYFDTVANVPILGATDSQICLEKYIKCALRPEWLNTNTNGALSDLNSNNILLFAISDDSTNATCLIDHVTTSVRIRFYD